MYILVPRCQYVHLRAPHDNQHGVQMYNVVPSCNRLNIVNMYNNVHVSACDNQNIAKMCNAVPPYDNQSIVHIYNAVSPCDYQTVKMYKRYATLWQSKYCPYVQRCATLYQSNIVHMYNAVPPCDNQNIVHMYNTATLWQSIVKMYNDVPPCDNENIVMYNTVPPCDN